LSQNSGQRRVGRDAALAVDDRGNAVPGTSICRANSAAEMPIFPEFFSKMFAGMDRGARHDDAS